MSIAPVVVASIVDQGFLPLTEIVATSIAASAPSGRAIDYHLFYDGPDSRISRRLGHWQRGPVTVHLHRLANPLQRYGTINGFPPASLARLLLPDLLPDQHRLIYLDADIVVGADLGELFDTPLDGLPIGAVVDRIVVEWALAPASPMPDTAHYLSETLGLRTEQQMRDYRQSGVLLMDLDALRALNFRDTAIGLLDRMAPQFRYADQCLINRALAGRMAVLDPRWNVPPHGLRPEAEAPALVPGFESYVRLQRSDPRIIHFAGLKPWKVWGQPGAGLWWRSAIAAGYGPHFGVPLLWATARQKAAGLMRRIRRLLAGRRTPA